MNDQRRDYFRIEYLPSDRPLIRIGSKEFDIIDLSEKGVKFACDRTYRPRKGSQVRGTIEFKDGKCLDVAGRVHRYIEKRRECVLTLTEGVPLAKMMEEQRHLIAKYKQG